MDETLQPCAYAGDDPTDDDDPQGLGAVPDCHKRYQRMTCADRVGYAYGYYRRELWESERAKGVSGKYDFIQAAGVVGNLMGESYLIPYQNQGGATGIASWNPTRWGNLKVYAKSHRSIDPRHGRGKRPWWSYKIQVHFVWWEMNVEPYDTPGTTTTVPHLEGATDIYRATLVFMRDYEENIYASTSDPEIHFDRRERDARYACRELSGQAQNCR